MNSWCLWPLAIFLDTCEHCRSLALVTHAGEFTSRERRSGVSEGGKSPVALAEGVGEAWVARAVRVETKEKIWMSCIATHFKG